MVKRWRPVAGVGGRCIISWAQVVASQTTVTVTGCCFVGLEATKQESAWIRTCAKHKE